LDTSVNGPAGPRPVFDGDACCDTRSHEVSELVKEVRLMLET
jgi:hypothetical protein